MSAYKMKPCKFYLQGNCRRGDQCTYIHDSNALARQPPNDVARRLQNAATVTRNLSSLADQMSSLSILTETQTRGTVVSEERALEVLFVIDVSGSMAGERISTVMQHIREIVQHMNTNDMFGLAHFSNTCAVSVLPQKIATLTSARIDSEIGNLYHLAQSGQSTALYDAIQKGIQVLHRPRRPSTAVEMIVLTDGEENASREANFTKLEQQLQHPGINNFHMILIAVDNGHLQELQKLCRPRHCKLLTNANANTAITDGMHEVHRRIQAHYRMTIIQERIEVAPHRPNNRRAQH